MSYRVVWRRKALTKLARLWAKATDPQAILDASYRITQAVQTDPRQTGESRQGDLRLVFDHPLGVLFRIDPNNQDVVIVNVGRSHP